MLRLLGRANRLVVGCSALRHSSSTSTSEGGASMKRVWGLWNEGNLFSLSVAELQQFLTTEGQQGLLKGDEKKALLVRRVEEYLHVKESKAKGRPVPSYDDVDPNVKGHRAVVQPETLLDLAQAGFYDGASHMAPKAFQLLVADTAIDLVVSRVNTQGFPGAPANMECYTLAGAEAEVAVKARYSKALQWCLLNMQNLQMDGEICVEFGKLLLSPAVIRKNRKVLSSWTLQQRVQATNPYQWIAHVPPTAAAVVESLLEAESFVSVTKAPVIGYDITVKRAKDSIAVELNRKGQVLGVFSKWSSVQTSHLVNAQGIDACLQLRSRPPLRRKDVELFSSVPIIKLEKENLSDVLPAEHGQVVYVSENEVRRWEKKTEHGVRFTVTEVKRDPLIVSHDEEEDSRIEYNILVTLSVAEKLNLSALAGEVYELTNKFAQVLSKPFVDAFGTQADGVSLAQE
jgi:hypothetical protein